MSKELEGTLRRMEKAAEVALHEILNEINEGENK